MSGCVWGVGGGGRVHSQAESFPERKINIAPLLAGIVLLNLQQVIIKTSGSDPLCTIKSEIIHSLLDKVGPYITTCAGKKTWFPA